MGRTVETTVVRTAACRAVAIVLAGTALLLAGCPASSLLNEVKYRTKGSYTQLASLTLPNATLSPAFSPAVTSYTASVGYTTTSITVIPMSYQASASIKVNGTALASGASSPAVPLAVGMNTIMLQVEYKDSSATTYTLQITRLSQVDLVALVVAASTSPMLSPAFRPLVTSYTLALANTETSVSITPTAADPLAAVVVSPSSPINVASLAVGATKSVTITVTVPGGGSSRVYTITISRLPLGYALDSTWGSGGRVGPDLSGDNRLYAPTAIAVGGGQVFIHDSRNFRIQDFDTSGNPVRRWGSYGSGSGQFDTTWGGGIAYYGGYVYDLNNGTIQKFLSSDGTYLLQFGSGFYNARIACDTGGYVYLADANNNRVVKFDSNGNQITAWSTANQPASIATDGSSVYVGGYSYIEKFTTSGGSQGSWPCSPLSPVQGLAVSGGFVYGGSWSSMARWTTSGGSLTTWTGLPPISDLATDGTNIYTNSGNDYRCYYYNASTGAPVGSWGSDLTTAATNGMKSPQRAVADSSKNIYVADTVNNRVLKFNSSGVYQSGWSLSGLSTPNGLAIDATNGWLYVADTGNSRVAKFNLSAGGTSISAVTGLNYPMGVAVDTSGRIYVANTSSGTVLMYNNAGTQQGTAISGFNNPRSIAVDPSNNIYVADSGNSCIKKFTQYMASFLLQWGSNGSGNGQFYNINDVAASAAGVLVSQSDNTAQQFDSAGAFISRVPSGTWSPTSPQQVVGSTLDSLGNLYIVDATNCSVKKYKPQ